MLRKADFRIVQKEDLPDSPSWIMTLLDPFNDMLQFMIDAFNGNIGTKNMSLQVIDMSFTAPFPTTSFLKTKSDPIQGVFIVRMSRPNGTTAGTWSSMNWKEESSNVVISDIVTGVGDFQVRFFVMY